MKLGALPELALAFGTLLIGCSRSPEPCASAGTCPEGQECLANRCVVAGGEPVARDSQRITLEPERIGVVSANTEPRGPELPGAVAFGSDADGALSLYLEFRPIWRTAQRVEAAFLVLEPMTGTPPASEDVPVEAWRVRGRWSNKTLEWLHQPAVAPPTSEGIARSSPPSPLRIDVTELVRYLHSHHEADFGLALKSGTGAGAGASYATGASGGRAPRLEVYLR